MRRILRIQAGHEWRALACILLTLSFCPVLTGQTASPALANCPVFPADNIWNTPIDGMPVDANSRAFVEAIGAEKPLHPDFGSGTYGGGPVGIPYAIVPGNQPRVRIQFHYAKESDSGDYPIPPNPPIEGGANSKGDRHILIVDRDKCVLWEIFAAMRQPDGTWRAGSGAIFDLKCNCLRQDGWTSADAAGLPILPGLVRYDEVAAGAIRHALRFTAPRTRNRSVWPATHFASSLSDIGLPPMGQRFRLKTEFDISRFSSQAQVILRALQKYGMMLADNGSSWFVSGAPDERWNNRVLDELKTVKGADFEAVDTSGLFVAHQSSRARQPN